MVYRKARRFSYPDSLYRWCKVVYSLRPIYARFQPLVGGSLGTVGTDFLSLLSIEFHYEQSATIRRVGEGSMRPGRAATRWFCRSRSTGLLRSGSEPIEERHAQCSGHWPAHWSGHIPGPSGHRLRRPPPRCRPSQRRSDEDSPRNGMTVHSLPSDVVTVGCSGTYTYERWQIEHEEFSIVTPGGHVVASYPPPLLEVKTDAHCSGISTFAEPFAQIGASWLSRWGKSVFDGLSSAVWIRTGR